MRHGMEKAALPHCTPLRANEDMCRERSWATTIATVGGSAGRLQDGVDARCVTVRGIGLSALDVASSIELASAKRCA